MINPETINRQIVLDGTRILERTGESLYRSNQIAIETETIGNEVVAELGEQRESLLRTRNRLDDANTQLLNVRSTLRKMGRNVIYNRLILILIIIIEVCIFGLIVFKRFFSKK